MALAQVPCVFCDGEGVMVEADVLTWEKQEAAKIIIDVAIKHGTTVALMRSATRAQKVADARFEAFYRIFSEVGMTQSAIGGLLGDRDHSTVLHGIRVHASRLDVGVVDNGSAAVAGSV